MDHVLASRQTTVLHREAMKPADKPGYPLD